MPYHNLAVPSLLSIDPGFDKTNENLSKINTSSEVCFSKVDNICIGNMMDLPKHISQKGMNSKTKKKQDKRNSQTRKHV
jgi:hypothetical protein